MKAFQHLSIVWLIAGSIALSACQSPAPAPAPPPMQGMAGGAPGNVDKSPAQSPSAVPPPPTSPSLVTTSQKSAENLPDDSEDWVDSSWKLLKSGVRSTFTMSAHKVRSPQGDLNFTHYQPIALDVSNMIIVDEYKSPMHEPNVEHLIPISPSDAMRIWLKDRIRTVGTDKTLQVIIKDASVIATPLPAADGSETRNRRYDARLEVEMRIYSNSGSALSEASLLVVATQSNTIGEEASVVERKAIYRQMMFDLMDSANAELEKQIFKYFTRYINYAQTP